MILLVPSVLLHAFNPILPWWIKSDLIPRECKRFQGIHFTLATLSHTALNIEREGPFVFIISLPTGGVGRLGLEPSRGNCILMSLQMSEQSRLEGPGHCGLSGRLVCFIAFDKEHARRQSPSAFVSGPLLMFPGRHISKGSVHFSLSTFTGVFVKVYSPAVLHSPFCHIFSPPYPIGREIDIQWVIAWWWQKKTWFRGLRLWVSTLPFHWLVWSWTEASPLRCRRGMESEACESSSNRASSV